MAYTTQLCFILIFWADKGYFYTPLGGFYASTHSEKAALTCFSLFLYIHL